MLDLDIPCDVTKLTKQICTPNNHWINYSFNNIHTSSPSRFSRSLSPATLPAIAPPPGPVRRGVSFAIVTAIQPSPDYPPTTTTTTHIPAFFPPSSASASIPPSTPLQTQSNPPDHHIIHPFLLLPDLNAIIPFPEPERGIQGKQTTACHPRAPPAECYIHLG